MQMKRRYVVALGVMLLVMGACTDDHELISDEEVSSRGIAYLVDDIADYDTASTRGVVSSVADLTTIEAYAFKSDGTQYIGTEDTGASLKYDSSTGNVSVLSGAARWPEDGSALNFYAFSPNSDECMTDKVVTNKSISFTIELPAEKAEDTDILFAYKKYVKETSYSGSVPLAFNHLLCRMSFGSLTYQESNLEVFPRRIVLRDVPTKATYKASTRMLSSEYNWWTAWKVDVVPTQPTDSIVLYEGDGTENLATVWESKVNKGGALDRQFLPGTYTVEMECHARVTYLTDDGIGPTWVVGDEEEYVTRSYSFDIYHSEIDSSTNNVGCSVTVNARVEYFGIPNLDFNIVVSDADLANNTSEVDLGTKTF